MTKGSLTNPTGRHLSLRNFLRFESILFEFLQVYPHTYKVTPTDLATTTFTARLRDAANAHLLHRFESKVDPDALRDAWSQSIVVISGDDVVVGTKDAIRDAIRSEVGIAPEPSAFLCELASPTLEQLNALAYLYATGVFTTPSRIGSIPPGFTPMLGMALEPRSDHFILL